MSNANIIRHVLKHTEHATDERRAFMFANLLEDIADTLAETPEEILQSAMFDNLRDFCDTIGVPFTAAEDQE